MSKNSILVFLLTALALLAAQSEFKVRNGYN